MIKRVGVFIDISNLYYSIINEYGRNAKINYHKYMGYVKNFGRVVEAVAYGAQEDGQSGIFIKHLKHVGFEIKYKTPRIYSNSNGIKKKADWDIGIVVDVIGRLAEYDLIILGSADSDFEPLVQHLKRSGKEVIVIACCISKVLKESATRYVEIPKSFLKER